MMQYVLETNALTKGILTIEYCLQIRRMIVLRRHSLRNILMQFVAKSLYYHGTNNNVE